LPGGLQGSGNLLVSPRVFYSSQRRSGEGGGGIFGKFLEYMRKDLKTNQELEASLRGLEEEKSKLQGSYWMQSTKENAVKIKDLSVHYFMVSINAVRDGWHWTTTSVRKMLGQAAETEIGKTTKGIASQVSKTAEDAAKKVSDGGDYVSKTEVYQKVQEGVQTVKKEFLDDIIQKSQPYKAPEKILKRTDPQRQSSFAAQAQEEEELQQTTIEPNEDEKQVVLTRQSRLYSWWSNLRENNPLSNLYYSAKMKYDESDNVLVRASRAVTDRVGDTFGGAMTQNDMAEALSEIRKLDPNFSKEKFVSVCEFDIIPTVLEAFLQGKLDVLKDWCHQPAYNVLSAQIEQNTSFGRKMDCKVLDVRDVDILMAKVLEQGPVLILTFAAQQLMMVRNGKGEIVEGGEDNIENVQYVWALCRDQEIYDPRTAWRVMEFGIQSNRKLLI
jgi:import inner membrane translocase subunit TIM44